MVQSYKYFLRFPNKVAEMLKKPFKQKKFMK